MIVKINSNTYDVVIIGAGISGLVCGCYLAKAGMKVLIVDQHYKPGGYCTSFNRKGFTFDAAAHSFGSYRKSGIMNRVLKELHIDKKLIIKRYQPTDIFISPNYKISFWADINKTIQEFQKAFPHESNNIIKYFYFFLNSNPFDFAALRNKTFKVLLDHYFIDEKLKSILSFPILGNGGLPPSLISAFMGAIIYREFLLDGGYYPKGGMQALPNELAERFKELGGELRLSCLVKKIQLKDNTAKGIFLDKDCFISSKNIVSSCDARQTFFNLIGKNNLDNNFVTMLKNMTPSLSFFLVFLGIDKYFQSLPKPGVCIWILPRYNIEDIYLSLKNRNINDLTGYMFRVSPDKKSVQAFVNSPFRNKRYWLNNKYNLLETFIKRIENIVPELSKHIVFKEAATPYTLKRYTLNYKGAAYGWASVPSQLFKTELRQVTSIHNLYLSGHWTAQTQGIAGAAYIGNKTANLILRKQKTCAIVKKYNG